MFSSNTSAVSGDAVFIEDVMSTYLYTGNGSSQTITNGIDLSTKGGLVWFKRRDAAVNNRLFDTARGATYALYSNLTNAQATEGSSLTSFDSSGFSLSSDSGVNLNNGTYTSWTFRKQPKFFDVVTYTGNGTTQNIAHNLGSTPGCIIVKSYSSAANYDWAVYHRSLGATKGVYLNTTQAEQTNNSLWNDTTPTSTQFTVGNSGGASSSTNANGVTYVAYLFAHDAGGFGLTGSDNVISCGSYTGTGSSVTVDLGYEPQWILTRNITDADDWFLFDNMRGIATGGTDAFLRPNLSNAENTASDVLDLTATGFKTVAAARHTNGKTYIYIAIRRGPMKVPTSGTSVFKPVTFSFDSFTTAGFPVDFLLSKQYNDVNSWRALDRLRGTTPPSLFTNSTSAESAEDLWRLDNSTGVNNVAGGTINGYENWMFQRAPSFFDVVCYTGTGSARTVTHNLGVVPEMMIVKGRAGTRGWRVYYGVNTKAAELNSTGSADTNSVFWNNTSPTASVFTVATDSDVNSSAVNYVAYLFATCAGVSKVGTYTGTATTLQVDCGFTGGARFVLIKRTDSTGGWYVWDTARGIVSGNDPYLLLNSSAAEVTNTDYVDTYSAGFEISSTAPAAINASGGTFIFLAIA